MRVAEATFAEIDGQSIRYLQRGTGKDIFMIHGSPGEIEWWMPTIELLEPEFRVTAIDLPGYGQSSGRRFNSNLENYSNFVRGCFTALGLVDPIVVGHSYGGGIALRLAVKQTPEIVSYVLVAPAAFAGRPDSLSRALVSIPILNRFFWLILPLLIGKSFVTNMTTAGFPSLPKDELDEIIEYRLKSWLQKKVIRTLRLQQNVRRKEFLYNSDRYPQISKRIIIVAGALDTAVRLESNQKLAANILNAELIVINDAGHTAQYTHPEVVRDAIRKITEST
jgi:pimeloyl-ACP methyl ester carboxylesterase